MDSRVSHTVLSFRMEREQTETGFKAFIPERL